MGGWEDEDRPHSSGGGGGGGYRMTEKAKGSTTTSRIGGKGNNNGSSGSNGGGGGGSSVTHKSSPTIFPRDRGVGGKRKGCYLVTVRVLERSVPNRLPKDHPDRIHMKRKPLGKAPAESTTRTVQFNVRQEATIVEIVSYVVNQLQLKSGLKWSCQYLGKHKN